MSVQVPVTSYYEVPPLHIPYYVERKKLFDRLEELLSNRTSSHPGIVVLLGMGGTGKTQLALNYCRRMKANGKYGGIFWLDSSSRNALESSMVAISKLLLPGRIVDNPHEGVKLVRTALSNWSDPWLLVFDNYDNPSDIHDLMRFFPDNTCGSILITSRSTLSKELGNVIELDRMEKHEGLELLLYVSQADSTDVAAAEKILARVEYLPLAIDQVRAYTSKQQLNLVDFESGYERRKRNFMTETPRVWQYRRSLPGMEEEISLNLLTTWELSFSLLDADMEHGGRLGDVLTLFAFLHPIGIREGLFRHDIGDGQFAKSPMTIFEENGDWSHDKFERAVICMQEHSLIRFSRQSGDEIAVSLHPMVSEWLRLRLEKGVLSTTLDMAASHLEIYLESAELDYPKRQEALLHMDSICRIATDANVKFCYAFGRFYGNHGRLKDAEIMFNRALAEYEKALGPEHSFSLDTVSNLGILYIRQGRFSDAESMHHRALAGSEKALGPEHPSTLKAVSNLGNLYASQGRFVDAEIMFHRALAGFENAFGADQSPTLNVVHSLGCLYVDQGRLADAEIMYQRALAGREKTLGPEHTYTLNTVSGLGNLYPRQGRLAQAEKMYQRALAGFEKALGPGHISTLYTVRGLGNLYVRQRRFADAEIMLRRALAGFKEALGPEHTDTLLTVRQLGTLLSSRAVCTLRSSKAFCRCRNNAPPCSSWIQGSIRAGAH